MNETTTTAGVDTYPSGLLRGSAGKEVYEIQRKRTEEYVGIMEALTTNTQRKILYGLVNGLGEASYRDLDQITTVSKRSLRRHASRLEQKGIVERRDANLGVISFPNYEVRVLAQHILYCYEDQLD